MTKKKLLGILSALALLLQPLSVLAAGGLDASFDTGSGPEGGFVPVIEAILLQDDGGVLLSGDFTSFNGVAGNGVVRVLDNGSVDETFESELDAWTTDWSTQLDGQIMAAGYFTDGIARLNTDGSIDTSFDPGTGFGSTPLSLAFQADGKIIVGGQFTSFNGTGRKYIARLNTDGSLDTSFDPGTGFSTTARKVLIQNDGKIIVGGDFTSFDSTTRNRIARLNTDGSIDTSFDPGTGFNNQVITALIQSDGKIIVGGQFTSFNGTERNRIARLNTDGSLDTSFDPGIGFNEKVYSIAIQSDGKIIVGGQFTSFNGTEHSGITRLNTDGSIDTSFDPGTGFNSVVISVVLQGDGQKVLAGGYFNEYNGTSVQNVARLNLVDVITNSTGSGNTYFKKNLLGKVFTNVPVPDPNIALSTPSSALIPASVPSVASAPVEPSLIPTSVPIAFKFTKNLTIGTNDAEVKLLQQYLNTHGYPVAVFGPGSPGNETTMFGVLTRAAVIKLQKANNINPAVGYFGPLTRAVVNGN